MSDERDLPDGEPSGVIDDLGDDDPHMCLACRTLDAADGVMDGQIGAHLKHFKVQDERTLVRRLRRAEDTIADGITTFAGSMNFVYIHGVWFAIWVLLNVGLAGVGLEFDKFPFGLLTMIVSLEAIFLATFVMISQNRQAARSDIRAKIDFENNIRSEVWAVHIGQALGIDVTHVEDIVQQVITTAEDGLSRG
jgi:uncharacterized membrane protein